ncbi:MAG: DUF1631 family protein [Proteobacteria bacterium]|nr:DUF1631 family protein [Pseudomonadota bacterium]MDA0927095.1 DUF1631 family protein [Pseudomonadota bacterium]
MSEVKEVVYTIRDAMNEELRPLVNGCLQDAGKSMRNHTATAMDGTRLLDGVDGVLDRFSTLLIDNFDCLVQYKEKKASVFDYGNLKLVEEADLEAMIAMEGMIAHARNTDIHQYICFSTRFGSLFVSTHIDESNNPMDPEQIGEAFKDALQPLGLKPASLLMAYRHFNSSVFHRLESVLEKANDILISKGIMPDLDISARNREEHKNKRSAPRKRTDPEERAFGKDGDAAGQHGGSSSELFSMMQNLLHGVGAQVSSNAVPAEHSSNLLMSGAAQSGMMVGGKRLQVLAPDKLLSLLDKLNANEIGQGVSAADNLSESIAQQLEQMGGKDVMQAIDSRSADVINLINLLYEAIWEDSTVPIPIKELIGRTQITALKIALAEPGFFDSDAHPMRVLVNELATAGISWTETEDLADDKMYAQMKSTVNKLITGFDGSSSYIEPLLEEFRYFKRHQLLAGQEEEARILQADDREERLDEIRQYARRKIGERILDPAMPPFVLGFLENMFHKFLVHILLREGPGGVSWRPVMTTIDVLLWTVQSERVPEDKPRFNKLKPRLMINLRKALDVAGFEKAEIDEALTQLQQAQEAAFVAKPDTREEVEESSLGFDEWMADARPSSAKSLLELADSDEHVKEVERLPIGIWMEFLAEGERTIRCTLAAKIDTIDKFVFVNAQGVKVVEKSRMGLAREMKAGTVKIISEAPLIDRAMETVIGKLRSGDERTA